MSSVDACRCHAEYWWNIGEIIVFYLPDKNIGGIFVLGRAFIFSQEDVYVVDVPPCGACHYCRCTDPECADCFLMYRFYGTRCARYIEFYYSDL